MNTHPLQQIPGHPALSDVVEKGRHFQEPSINHQPSTINTPPPVQPGWEEWPKIDAAALEQLNTLDTFDRAVEAARASGGPSAALQALIQRPIKVGPYRLTAVASYHFMFLQLIGSPFVSGGQIKQEEMPIHLAKALLAFASVPVEQDLTRPDLTHEADPPCYLHFADDGPHVDQALLNQDAWALSARLSPTDLARATNWIIAQIGGIASLFPDSTGEEAGNFPTAGTPASPPPAAPPAPAPPAGSTSS